MLARVVAALVIGGSFKFADEAVYVDTARRLAEGDGFGADYRRVPAYPVFLALLSLGLPAGLTYIRIAQAVVAGLGAVLVFGLSDRIFGRRVAVLAGLVYALDPLLGRTRPDRDWHPRDGRITDLGLHVDVDASLGHHILVTIAAAPAATA